MLKAIKNSGSKPKTQEKLRTRYNSHLFLIRVKKDNFQNMLIMNWIDSSAILWISSLSVTSISLHFRVKNVHLEMSGNPSTSTCPSSPITFGRVFEGTSLFEVLDFVNCNLQLFPIWSKWKLLKSTEESSFLMDFQPFNLQRSSHNLQRGSTTCGVSISPIKMFFTLFSYWWWCSFLVFCKARSEAKNCGRSVHEPRWG